MQKYTKNEDLSYARQVFLMAPEADYRSLKLIKQRKDIVNKSVDKGSSTIVLNKSDYIF